MITWLISIVGALVVDALERPGRLGDFYPKTARGEMGSGGYGWTTMHGRNVTWLIEEGEAVWIEARYLRPMSGNIFDAEKLGAVAQALKDGRELTLMAPFGQPHRITRSWMEESLQYAEDEEPWTTGDADMDLYLTDVDEWLEKSGWSRDEEGVDELIAEMEAEVVEAEATGQGDFGAWTSSVRDGNHRTFGAVLGGEEAVAVRIYDCDISGLQEDLHRGVWRKGHRELLVKMIEDSGGVPEWLERHARKHPLMIEGIEIPEDPLTLEEQLDDADGDNAAILRALEAAGAWEVPLTHPTEALWRVDDQLIEWDRANEEAQVHDVEDWLDNVDPEVYDPGYDQRFNDDFWSWPPVLYHATETEHLADILAEGLLPMSQTRGISNRSTGPAVYTTMELEETAAGSYGDVVLALDMAAMKEAGLTPWVSQEPDVQRHEMLRSLAHLLQAEDFEAHIEGGMSSWTVVVHGVVPARFLSVED
jgi:hypothetical protein